MDETYWSAVRAMRLGVADLLETLPQGGWDAPSLCRGWRVRDVAGHLSIVPTITTWDMVSAAPRARFNPNRVNTRIAIQQGSRDRGEILHQLRTHAADRRTATMLDARDVLFDVIVHSQDIAIPLGRVFPVPADATRMGLDRVWAMGWPFHASRRLAGLTLRAQDVDWAVGVGPEVSGTALELLLLLTGRTATVIDSLHGAGTGDVRLRARA